jgi:hypothetical protein
MTLKLMEDQLHIYWKMFSQTVLKIWERGNTAKFITHSPWMTAFFHDFEILPGPATLLIHLILQQQAILYSPK